jgi:methionine aminopeptidase
VFQQGKGVKGYFTHFLLPTFVLNQPLGIAFPTTISPNNFVCHLAPLESDPEAKINLKNGDFVKM